MLGSFLIAFYWGTLVRAEVKPLCLFKPKNSAAQLFVLSDSQTQRVWIGETPVGTESAVSRSFRFVAGESKPNRFLFRTEDTDFVLEPISPKEFCRVEARPNGVRSLFLDPCHSGSVICSQVKRLANGAKVYLQVRTHNDGEKELAVLCRASSPSGPWVRDSLLGDERARVERFARGAKTLLRRPAEDGEYEELVEVDVEAIDRGECRLIDRRARSTL